MNMADLKPYHIELHIQEIAKRKASNSRYSLRAFARFLGIAPSTLSRVLANHQELSISGSKKIMRKLKFSEEQKITFITSVAEEKKRRAIQNLTQGLESVSSSHDFGFTLEGVVDIAVKDFADACIINIARADNSLLVHAKHREELFQNFYENTKAIKKIVDDLCPNNIPCLVTKDDDNKGVLTILEASSLIIIPLFFGEKIIGSMTLIRSELRGPFSREDLEIAIQLAIRVILASGFGVREPC
jgi:transcriptional regulator with GAF, ATPase, and Fis domain